MADTELLIKIVADYENFKKILDKAQKDVEKVNKARSLGLDQKQQLRLANQLAKAESTRTKELERQEKLRKKEVERRERENKFSKGLFGDRGISWRSRWADPEASKGGPLRRAFGGTVTQRGLGEATSAVGKGLAGVAGGIAGFAIHGAMVGYHKYLQKELAIGKLSGVAARGGQIRQALGGAQAGRYGFNSAEAAEMLPNMARATGVLNPRQMFQAMRATGMGAGEVGGVFKAIKSTGASFETPAGGGESAGMKTFTKMMAGAQAAGLEHAEIPEYLEQVVGSINEMKESLVDVNVNSLNKQLAMLGRLSPAMAQGGGARILSSVHKAFTSPGGGEWGQALMRSAMGFGAPGGQTGFYQAERMRQQGVNDPKNIPRLLDQLRKMFPNAEARAYAGSQALGLSMEQYDKLEQAVGKGEQEKISKIIEESKPIEEQALAAMKGVLGETKRQAALFEKGVVAGQIAAPIIEKLEDLSHDALLKILEYVRDIYEVVSSWIGEKGGSSEANAVIKEASERLGKVDLSGKGKTEQDKFWKDLDESVKKGYQRTVDTRLTTEDVVGGALYGEARKSEVSLATTALNSFSANTKNLIQTMQKLSGVSKITPEAAEFVKKGLAAASRGEVLSKESFLPVAQSYAAGASTPEKKAAAARFVENFKIRAQEEQRKVAIDRDVAAKMASKTPAGVDPAMWQRALAAGATPKVITVDLNVNHTVNGRKTSGDGSTSFSAPVRDKKQPTSVVSTSAK